MLFDIKGEKINKNLFITSFFFLFLLSFGYFFVSLHTDYKCSIVVEDEFFLDFK